MQKRVINFCDDEAQLHALLFYIFCSSLEKMILINNLKLSSRHQFLLKIENIDQNSDEVIEIHLHFAYRGLTYWFICQCERWDNADFFDS